MNDKKKTETKAPANAGLISLLRRHLNLFKALGFHIDESRIGDPKRPSVEIVTGLLWDRDDNVTERLQIVDALAAKHFKGLRKNGGHYSAVFELDGVVSFSQRVKGERNAVPFDDNGELRVQPASVNCTTDHTGRSTLPVGVAMDAVVVWRYEGGRKIAGKALPFDIDGAVANGWFNLTDQPTRSLVELTLFPVLNRRGRGGREVVEGQAYHTSGKRIFCTLPIDWANQGDYLLIERPDMFVAIPCAQVDSEEAGEAIARAEEKPELEPEEYDCGAYRGNIWNDLAKHGVTRDMSYGDLQKLRRRLYETKHPDKVAASVKGVLSGEALESVVATASVQFSPIEAAFNRVLEIRGAEWDAVEVALGDTKLADVLGEEDLKKVRGRKSGVDALTNFVSIGLKVEFDWKNGNHVGLRRKALSELAKAAKVEEPAEDDAAAETPPVAAGEGESAPT